MEQDTSALKSEVNYPGLKTGMQTASETKQRTRRQAKLQQSYGLQERSCASPALTSSGHAKPEIARGLSRGTQVKHIKHGLTYTGGTLKGRVSLHSMARGKRLTQGARLEEIVILTRLFWRGALLSGLKTGVSAALHPGGRYERKD